MGKKRRHPNMDGEQAKDMIHIESVEALHGKKEKSPQDLKEQLQTLQAEVRDIQREIGEIEKKSSAVEKKRDQQESYITILKEKLREEAKAQRIAEERLRNANYRYFTDLMQLRQIIDLQSLND